MANKFRRKVKSLDALTIVMYHTAIHKILLYRKDGSTKTKYHASNTSIPMSNIDTLEFIDLTLNIHGDLNDILQSLAVTYKIDVNVVCVQKSKFTTHYTATISGLVENHIVKVAPSDSKIGIILNTICTIEKYL
jgi:hypothetical protein